MDFVAVNAIFIPDSRLWNKSIKVADWLSRGGEVNFQLDGINFLPHISIYVAEYPVENVEKVCEQVEALSREITQVDFEFDGYQDDGKYVWVDFKNDKELQRIHKQFVETLNPLREGHIRDKDLQKIAEGKVGLKAAENIRMYGYSLVMDLFHPHITFSTLKSPRLKVSDKITEMFGQTQGGSKKIAVSDFSEFGTCAKIIKEFSLQKN